MLPHRPLATGLFCLGCCLGLLWRLPPAPLEKSPAAAALAPAPAAAASTEGAAPCLLRPPSVNVVDVAAAAATPELVAQLIRLAGNERVTAVDDHPVASDLAAGAWIAARIAGMPPAERRAPIDRGDYIDLTVEGEACSRRVLVLFH